MLNDKVGIGVLVSGGGTNLQALIDAQAAGTLSDGDIRVVISTRPDAYALTRAQNAGIHCKYIPRANFEADALELLAAHNVSLIVLAGFMRILSEDFISRAPGRILNVHPALIPAFAGKGFYGLKVHEAALARGVKLTGATVHIVNEIPDGGEILAQKAVNVMPGDTPETLQARVMREAEWVLLPRCVQDVCARARGGN